MTSPSVVEKVQPILWSAEIEKEAVSTEAMECAVNTALGKEPKFHKENVFEIQLHSSNYI